MLDTEWISVKDKLPKRNQPIIFLFVDENNIKNIGKTYFNIRKNLPKGLTHWATALTGDFSCPCH